MASWQWHDDKRWVAYPPAVAQRLEAEQPPFVVEVDPERDVKSVDPTEIMRLYDTLPADFAGLCALQVRKDDPTRIRLVRRVPTAPVFVKQTAYVCADTFATPAAARECYLAAGLHGCLMVSPDKAQLFVFGPNTRITEGVKRCVVRVKDVGRKVVRAEWVTASIAKGGVEAVKAFDMTKDVIQRYDEACDLFTADKAAFLTLHAFDPFDASESEEAETFVAPDDDEPMLMKIGHRVFEGECLDMGTKSTLKVVVTRDGSGGDGSVRGYFVWGPPERLTRVEGTRTGNWISLKEVAVARGPDAPLREFDVQILDAATLKGNVKNSLDVTFLVKRIKALPHLQVVDDELRGKVVGKTFAVETTGTVVERDGKYVFACGKDGRMLELRIRRHEVAGFLAAFGPGN